MTNYKDVNLQVLSVVADGPEVALSREFAEKSVVKTIRSLTVWTICKECNSSTSDGQHANGT